MLNHLTFEQTIQLSQKLLEEHRGEWLAEGVNTSLSLRSAIYFACFTPEQSKFSLYEDLNSNMAYLEYECEALGIKRRIGRTVLYNQSHIAKDYLADLIEDAVHFVAINEYGGDGHPNNEYSKFTDEERPAFWEKFEDVVRTVLKLARGLRHDAASELEELNLAEGRDSDARWARVKANEYNDMPYCGDLRKRVPIDSQAGYRAIFDKLIYDHRDSALLEGIEPEYDWRDHHDDEMQRALWVAEWDDLDAENITKN
ncbi:hypothetical protein [Mesorhizobium denitrificans]|uniref:Uncharacterized protein n=1 Tax=Mesorhizobium denitrificans TaxID=2294114 RepID=A0A371XDU6_9HYPH|nr:hypothetical protein [Mesorhizobium denitrificans]RFC67382.1 hypothetical protein DY251_12655 [Mesorhizobium denitrificans]